LENILLEPSRGSCVGRTLLEGRIVHIHDIQDDPEYALETSQLEGWRTMLGVPLLREGTPIGVIALVRSTPRPFTAQQIELVTTFADQAVIAIENVMKSSRAPGNSPQRWSIKPQPAKFST
jgi:GAF domain-containing protein